MNSDKNIEKLIEQFRPAGPGDELHDAIFGNVQQEVVRSKPILKWSAIAAGMMIAFMLAGYYLFGPTANQQTNVPIEEISLATMERQIERAGQAAQLLAVADILAAQPGGQEYAIKQYQNLIEDYPEMEQVKEAKEKLFTLKKGV